MSKVFEIVQAMSGQGNSITIPGPYLDFFAGDRQSHLLGAILNQLVFWSSGKSSLDDGWFYKDHITLAKEVRAKDSDVVRKAMYKITTQYLAGVIEEDTRHVNGTPKKHYRIDQEALIAKIFPEIMDSAQEPNRSKVLKTMETAQEPNGNGSRAECKRPKSRILETAQEPNANGSQAESILYTDLKNTDLKTDLKKQAGEISPVDNFSENHPATITFDAKKNLKGSADDLEFSKWFYSRCVEVREQIAEFDGTVSRLEEPDWSVWANEVRLLREGQGCTHASMRTMTDRILADSYWWNKIESVMDLRSKWASLAVKLCPVNLATGGNLGFSGKVDTNIPKGFRG
ncbi:TPA: hypothetical protein ACNP37_005267 [Raoultella ornithinolytica]|uniref:hypothetical protein n=1 Tax=Raoultella ornithinolytica TaxID=54291 RepID=UPI0023504952|nr:hypothetical protein [Raoultella ornithinolytica]MDC7941338.1 hypothetical protein [Raoultella ornithinolytica]